MLINHSSSLWLQEDWPWHFDMFGVFLHKSLGPLFPNTIRWKAITKVSTQDLINMFLQSMVAQWKPLVAQLNYVCNDNLCFSVCQPTLHCISISTTSYSLCTSDQPCIADLDIFASLLPTSLCILHGHSVCTLSLWLFLNSPGLPFCIFFTDCLGFCGIRLGSARHWWLWYGCSRYKCNIGLEIIIFIFHVNEVTVNWRASHSAKQPTAWCWWKHDYFSMNMFNPSQTFLRHLCMSTSYILKPILLSKSV